MSAPRLVVTPYTPTATPTHGHGVYLRGLLRAMVQKAPLIVVHPADGPIDPHVERHAVEIATFAPARQGFDRVRDIRAIATGRMLRTAAFDLDEIRQTVRLLVEEHGVRTVWAEGIELGDVAATAPTPAARLVVIHEAARFSSGRVARGLTDRIVQVLDRSATRRQERRVTTRVDAVVAFTPRDAQAIDHRRASPIHVVPLGTDLPVDALDPEGVEGRVVFVGNFRHRPNVDAAERLVNDIAPILRGRLPDVEIRIVGANPPPGIVALVGPGVTVTGYVDDIAGELDRAAVVVAPIDRGGGTRIKVLEALAAGKAVVASPMAIEGLSGNVVEALIVAEDDAAFADALERLLLDRHRRRALAVAARVWAERTRSWSTVAEAHLDLHRKVARR